VCYTGIDEIGAIPDKLAPDNRFATHCLISKNTTALPDGQSGHTKSLGNEKTAIGRRFPRTEYISIYA